MKLSKTILAVLFWYGSQLAYAGEPNMSVSKNLAAKIQAQASQKLDQAKVVADPKGAPSQKIKLDSDKRGSFLQEIEKYKQKKNQTELAPGPGDWGGADDLKVRLLQVRKMTGDFLRRIKSLKDIDRLKDDKLISDNTYQLLTKDLQTTESNLQLKLGIGLRGYLMGMKPIFIDSGCSQEIADYPFSFRLQDGEGFMCVSRPMLRDLIKDGNLSDEQLASYLIHEALHFTGVRDHIFAQTVADELAALMQTQNIPECKVNAGLSADGTNALINEKVSKCHLVIPSGEFIVTFYNTMMGKGFSLNDDTYFMTKKDVYFAYSSGSNQIYLESVDLSKLCPEQGNLQVTDLLDLLSERQAYADVMFSYWFPSKQKAAIVGVSPSATVTLKAYNDKQYLNFSLKGTGYGFPQKYDSLNMTGVSTVVCLLPVKKSN